MRLRHTQQVFPIAELSWRKELEKLVVRFKAWPCYCHVCGRWTVVAVRHANLRDTGVCIRCRSFNRQRQAAVVICQSFGTHARSKSLREMARKNPHLRVYNTEASRAIHRSLSSLPGYVCSEYMGSDVQGGTMMNGVRHEDLQALTFADETLDLVISEDVLEHVPDPYRAHAEVFRVLRPGGRHVFTVPFHPTELNDDVRADLDAEGRPRLLKKPIYHRDPVRPEGSLVFTIFGLEMLVSLRKLGFRTNFYRLYRPWQGIFGQNGFVFEAAKATPDQRDQE